QALQRLLAAAATIEVPHQLRLLRLGHRAVEQLAEPGRAGAGELCGHRRYSLCNSWTCSFSRAITRLLATYTAPTDRPSASATSPADLPSTAVSQNACQVFSWKSARTCSAAQANRRRSYSASHSAESSAGAGCCSSRPCTALSPLPWACRARAASRLLSLLR